jgi:excisionase family DNA binding protein
VTEKLYTTDEVAAICRVTIWTVREWIKEGKMKAVKPGKAYLITETDLKNYLEEQHG